MVEEKPSSTPPLSPNSSFSKKEAGSAPRVEPRYTRHAFMSLLALSTHELIAWIVVASASARKGSSEWKTASNSE